MLHCVRESIKLYDIRNEMKIITISLHTYITQLRQSVV